MDRRKKAGSQGGEWGRGRREALEDILEFHGRIAQNRDTHLSMGWYGLHLTLVLTGIVPESVCLPTGLFSLVVIQSPGSRWHRTVKHPY